MAEKNSAVGPRPSESSRRPHSGVMGVLSTEAESQSRGCLGEEGETSECFWCMKGLEGRRREAIKTKGVEEAGKREQIG